MQDLATISGHLTPQSLDRELDKLDRDVPVYLYGAKPKHLAKVKRQVAALKRKNVRFFVQGRTYDF